MWDETGETEVWEENKHQWKEIMDALFRIINSPQCRELHVSGVKFLPDEWIMIADHCPFLQNVDNTHGTSFDPTVLFDVLSRLRLVTTFWISPPGDHDINSQKRQWAHLAKTYHWIDFGFWLNELKKAQFPSHRR